MAVNEADILNKLNIGVSRPDPVGDAVVIAIQSTNAEAIKKARSILMKKGSGTLAQGVHALPIVHSGTSYSFEIHAPDYADFVDKGVNGVEQTRGSIYSFKSSHPSKKHVAAIMQWIPVAGLTLRDGHPKKDPYKAMAYAVATSVKQKGLKATPFMEHSFGKDYQIDMAFALKVAMGRAVQMVFKQIADKHKTQA